MIQFKLALEYQEIKQYKQSIKNYKALLNKGVDSFVILNNLAWIYSEQKNVKALGYAIKAYKKAPQSGVVADTYGYILFKNGDKKEALKLLKKAVRLAPKLQKIQLHLAEVYLAHQQKAEAKEILQVIIDKGGDDKIIALNLMATL